MDIALSHAAQTALNAHAIEVERSRGWAELFIRYHVSADDTTLTIETPRQESWENERDICYDLLAKDLRECGFSLLYPLSTSTAENTTPTEEKGSFFRQYLAQVKREKLSARQKEEERQQPHRITIDMKAEGFAEALTKLEALTAERAEKNNQRHVSNQQCDINRAIDMIERQLPETPNTTVAALTVQRLHALADRMAEKWEVVPSRDVVGTHTHQLAEQAAKTGQSLGKN